MRKKTKRISGLVTDCMDKAILNAHYATKQLRNVAAFMVDASRLNELRDRLIAVVDDMRKISTELKNGKDN